MTLAMGDVQVGAIVEECFDDTPNKDYGKRLKIRRRGVVERVVMSSGQEFNDGSDIREIWVRFHKDRPCEKVANARLALFRPYDAAQAFKVKERRDNELAEDIMAERKTASRAPDDDGPTLLVDHTGLEQGERVSQETFQEKFPS